MEPTRVDLSDYITALLSHDISNFNQTSRGYLEMLLAEQMGTLNPDQLRAMAICLRQTTRIQNLIDAGRLMVQLTSTPINVRAQDLDGAITEAIRQVENEFSEREVRVSFTEDDREALAEGYLQNLMRQLISNGVRHNDSKVVEISVEITAAEEPVPHWRILVKDNGNGVQAGRQEDLFDRVAAREVHGAGLGLALASNLLKRWGGTIWLEGSTEGDGSTFGVTVPRV
jgi:signal transduction histidine kinase